MGYFDKEKDGSIVHEISIKPTLESGDLYLVFKNPRDAEQFVLNADWVVLSR